MEYLAMTAGERILTGATVVVTEVLGSDLVQVENMPIKTTHEAIATNA
jgi:hypothetical protein